MQQCLLLGNALQLCAALPHGIGPEAILDLYNIELPARTLRIAPWIGDGPPGLAAMPSIDSPQIAKRVEVAEFAEEPGHWRTPARREEIQKIAHELDITIEVVVVVVGELVKQAAVCFARTAVVAHQRIADQRLHQMINRFKDVGADIAIELTAERVEDH